MVWVGYEKKAIAAICCVVLRISLLANGTSFQKGEVEAERNFFLVAPPSLFFSFRVTVCKV